MDVFSEWRLESCGEMAEITAMSIGLVLGLCLLCLARRHLSVNDRKVRH